MLWPLRKNDFTEAIVNHKVANVTIKTGKNNAVVAPFAGVVSVLEPDKDGIGGVAVTHIISDTKSYAVMMRGLLPNSNIKAGVIVKEGDTLGPTQGDLLWVGKIQTGKNIVSTNPIEMGGLLGGLFFLGDTDQDLLFSGTKEDKRGIADKAGDAVITGLTFLAGIGLGRLTKGSS